MHYKAGPARAMGGGLREVARYSVTGRPGNGFLLAIGDNGSLFTSHLWAITEEKKRPKVKEALLMDFFFFFF